MNSLNKKVLVTGVTGFLGSHTTIELLNKGYEVIGTLRDISRAETIENIISRNTNHVNHLKLKLADLNDYKVWEEILKDVDYVLHVASPFPTTLPRDEKELVIPAKEGTLNILKSAVKNNVKRVVVVSSSGAVAYGKRKNQRSNIFAESDWTDISNREDTTPYFRSKTIAEKAAWEFVKNSSSELELVTVCPAAILGPVLEEDFGTSANIVLKILDGSSPAIPNIGFEIVDVRSVTQLLVKSLEMPEASGQRFIASAGFLSFMQVADILREAYPDKKIPKRMLPDFAVRLFSYFEKTLKPILIDLGIERKLDNTKARNVLNWQPISPKQAVLTCAESMLQYDSSLQINAGYNRLLFK